MKEQLRNIIMNKLNTDQKTAEALIRSGQVLINETLATKPGFRYPIDATIRVKPQKRYVSRAAEKLLAGINHFKPEIKNKVFIDCGSSTGGFTQVLLEHGAQLVYAVDSGTNQLDYSLRTHPQVISMEGMRVQTIAINELQPPPEKATCDASFTSCIPIIKHLHQNSTVQEILLLIKPQFEFVRLNKYIPLNKTFNGIVTDKNDRLSIVRYVINEIDTLGFYSNGEIESPLAGADGNIEYIAYLTRK